MFVETSLQLLTSLTSAKEWSLLGQAGREGSHENIILILFCFYFYMSRLGQGKIEKIEICFEI